MISVGRHQLAATVFGEGAPTVVIEPSFGGAAEDWEKIAQTLAEETTVITYDRAPYGASSAARDARTPRDIAADLDGLLRELGVTGPVVLVGHSAGGHLHPRLRRGAPGPGGRHGPRRVQPRGPAAGARPAAVAEEPAGQRARDPGDHPRVAAIAPRRRPALDHPRVADVPPVHRRGAGACRPAGSATGRLSSLPARRAIRRFPTRCTQAWHDLHRDLAGLSANSRHVLSDSSDHYLNLGDPDLVTSAIRDVVQCARSGALLAEVAAVSDGE